MKSMELDFDVEVLEAAQPHGGSYLALVFTFVKSGRKIYRGSIFFLFHGNGGEFEGAGSGACYRGICLAPRTLFFVSGGILGGMGGRGCFGSRAPVPATQDHGTYETTSISTDASALATPFVRGSGLFTGASGRM